MEMTFLKKVIKSENIDNIQKKENVAYYHNYIPFCHNIKFSQITMIVEISSGVLTLTIYFLKQKENLGFNLQTLSRLSWSDIGDYFSNLINEMGLGLGLGLNVSDISSGSGSGNASNSQYQPSYLLEPNLANQFAYYYNTMLGIPGEKTESANLLEKRKSKKGEDIFEKISNIRNIINNFWNTK